MQHFIGTYECKADVKGRIMLPSALKKQLSNSLHRGFVIKRAVFNKCLELYPLDQWVSLMEKVNKLNRFKKKNNDFIRRFTAGVKLVEIDTTGRLLIPKDLTNHAKISKEVVVSSVVNILEIWDKTFYEKSIDEATTDFALAEEVMGDKVETIYHKTVLLHEAVEGLNINPKGIYVDVTFGGGHSRRFSVFSANGKLFAFDQDEEAFTNQFDDPRFQLIKEIFW